MLKDDIKCPRCQQLAKKIFNKQDKITKVYCTACQYDKNINQYKQDYNIYNNK